MDPWGPAIDAMLAADAIATRKSKTGLSVPQGSWRQFACFHAVGSMPPPRDRKFRFTRSEKFAILPASFPPSRPAVRAVECIDPV